MNAQRSSGSDEAAAGPAVERGAAGPVQGRQLGDHDLRALTWLAGAASDGDGRFFGHCVAELVEAYAVDHAFIAVMPGVVDDAARARPGARLNLETIALAGGSGLSGTLDYPLAGSPCQDAIAHEQLMVGNAAAQSYPACAWLAEWQIEGYLGSVLRLPGGDPLGVLVLASRHPLTHVSATRSVLALFAERIARELLQRQAELQRSLAMSAFEHSPLAIMVSDAGHRVRHVNAAFTTITGWSAADIIGQRDSLLSAGRDDPGVREAMLAALERGDTWRGELWSRRHDGEVFPEYRTVVAVRDELHRLRHYVSLFSDISGEKFSAERIYRLAHYDATTELPNRVLLQDRLLSAINHAARSGTRLALLFLDLDGFKAINDRLGHVAGDELLRQVGARLVARLRKVDVVARLGGDEFAVVLGDVVSDSDVQAIANQLLAAVVEPYELAGQHGRVTTSIGIALYPEDGGDVQDLLKHADAAMYRAKERGKNQYAFYEPEMNRRAEARRHMADALREALAEEAFELCFQPQYDLADGSLAAVEALVRWKSGDGESVPPSRFIPVAEDSGLILALGEWVLNEACRQAVQWLDQGLDFGRLAINVSGRQFVDAGLPVSIARTLERCGLPAERLELEVSEHSVMEGPVRAEKQLQDLSNMGIGLVIDDFGVANASMAQLQRLPVAKLKVDHSFVRDIASDPHDAAIVSAIVAMGHSLGLKVAAEGVETTEQRRFLRSIGCDEAQGYLFGRPVPGDALNVLLLYAPAR